MSTERPILFSGAMVRALLAGAKTQTRRVVKFQGADVIDERVVGSGEATSEAPWPWSPQHDEWVACPYGAPGDRLWVRETIERGRQLFRMGEMRDTAVYAADGAETKLDSWGWQRDVLPSIHCPRGLSRITLHVTGVRVERLQDISEADAIAEGIPVHSRRRDWVPLYGLEGVTNTGLLEARDAYRELWESINGAESWAKNPWVWVIEFRKAKP